MNLLIITQLWKTKPDATLDEIEAPAPDAEVTPVALHYEDVHQYQAVFKPLVRGAGNWKGKRATSRRSRKTRAFMVSAHTVLQICRQMHRSSWRRPMTDP